MYLRLGIPTTGPWNTATPTFSPQTNPNVLAWYDTRGTVATSGSNVTSWSDRSANGLTLTAPGGAEPTWNATDSGIANEPSISFPTANTARLDSGTISGAPRSQPLTYYFVCRWNPIPSYYYLCDTPTGGRLAILDNGAASPYVFAGTNLNGAGSFPASPNWFVGCVVFNGASSAVYINDASTSVLSGDAGANTLSALRLGANQTASVGFGGRIAAFGIFAGAQNITERTEMFAGLKARYGL